MLADDTGCVFNDSFLVCVGHGCHFVHFGVDPFLRFCRKVNAFLDGVIIKGVNPVFLLELVVGWHRCHGVIVDEVQLRC